MEHSVSPVNPDNPDVRLIWRFAQRYQLREAIVAIALILYRENGLLSAVRYLWHTQKAQAVRSALPKRFKSALPRDLRTLLHALPATFTRDEARRRYMELNDELRPWASVWAKLRRHYLELAERRTRHAGHVYRVKSENN